MNEADTRANKIEPALKQAGWDTVEGSKIMREVVITLGRLEGQGRRARGLRADFVLEYRKSKVAVIEAKAWDRPLTEGVAQAKEYAGKLSLRFAYATNGRGIYEIDMKTGKEGEIERYPTPEEIWQKLALTPNAWQERFSQIPLENRGGSQTVRYYQEIAIERALNALASGKKRILLTLATGTGKTLIAFQIAWKLFKSRWNRQGTSERQPRILFLSDRNILADQAYNAFSPFPEDAMIRIEPGDLRRRGRVPTNGHLFFTIFQTFMSGPEKEGRPSPSFGQYAPDFFDLIIVDECHRGGANDESQWRSILEHFTQAVQLGLTATPKRDVNADTYAYFGEPVYTYALKDGINDGFLTPFQVKQFTGTLDEYTYDAADTIVSGEVEEGQTYEEEDFQRAIVIPQREEHRVETLLAEIRPNDKTLIFCVNQEHALTIRDLINQKKQSLDPNYCHRVTSNDGVLGEQHLRDFQDNERQIPTILTTSHKLSTGVDARNVRNIVLFRKIRSMIEFKQIIGRGTRLYEGKDYFTIYDFVRAHELFSDPAWDGEPIAPPSKEPNYSDPPKRAPLGSISEGIPQPYQERLVIRLADGKARVLRSTLATTFWHTSGRQLSSAEFLEALYGTLPDLFADEEELRRLWSDPATRQKLLGGLREKGFGAEALCEMQRIIDAEKSDLFDVLAHIAYALPPLTREERALRAKLVLSSHFNSTQQIFLDFVLQHYVKEGVNELEEGKLRNFLILKYGGVTEAKESLGDLRTIRNVFLGFQRFLYEALAS